MKFFTTFLLLPALACYPFFAMAQSGNSISHLKQKLKAFQQNENYLTDTNYINTLTDLAYEYSFGYPDSALLILKGNAERCHTSGYIKGEIDTYIIQGDAFQNKGLYKQALENFEKSFQLASKNKYKTEESTILNRVGTIHLNQGNYPEALRKFYESLKDAEAAGNQELTGATLNNIATVQYYQLKFNQAESTYLQQLQIAQNMHDTSGISIVYNNIGEVNLKQKDLQKALHNLTTAYNLALKINDRQMLLNSELSLAETYFELDSLHKAEALFNNALTLSKQTGQQALVSSALIGLAKTNYKLGLPAMALTNGLDGLQKAQQIGQVQLLRDANEIVSSVYAVMNDDGNALKYYKAYKVFSDSMNNLESQRAVAIERDKYEFSKKENEFNRKAFQQRWIIISAFAALLLLVVILWIIMRNKNRLKHTNHQLQQKNIVIENEKLKTEATLTELKATQAQLIQSEKMASLGELTAGIAHEIQNPLNFVNNFSELNSELLEELKSQKSTLNNEEAHELLNNIAANEEKINHYGKRADAIVKGMLQHSRKHTGKKEPANINALCDEFLRLSYNGFRLKNQGLPTGQGGFIADIKTDFDNTIGNINIASQDISRVLLNLFNNAFYAVNEKKKSYQLSGNDYQPTVSVQTKKLGNKVEIKVSDNGIGIPLHIIDKIFQPFFTTKPTGQGTGLGLSLAYDIITKEHKGSIKVESMPYGQEGNKIEGATLTILLPV